MSSSLKNWILELIEDEQEGSENYVDLANELAGRGLPRSLSERIFKMADDENKHRRVLISILKFLERQ